jgi:hypothetical protein
VTLRSRFYDSLLQLFAGSINEQLGDDVSSHFESSTLQPFRPTFSTQVFQSKLAAFSIAAKYQTSLRIVLLLHTYR